jgi:hypothetical protein
MYMSRKGKVGGKKEESKKRHARVFYPRERERTRAS